MQTILIFDNPYFPHLQGLSSFIRTILGLGPAPLLIIRKMLLIHTLFLLFPVQVPFGDIVVHLARRFLVPSPVSYALKSSTLFVLTKHVNGVALNTRVVNHNFRNALPLTLHYNFWGYFTSSSNLFYERWLYCFSTHSHRGFKPVQFESILRAMQCVLGALCAKVEVAENNACGRTTASQL